jgi:hypothetical protein
MVLEGLALLHGPSLGACADPAALGACADLHAPAASFLERPPPPNFEAPPEPRHECTPWRVNWSAESLNRDIEAAQRLCPRPLAGKYWYELERLQMHLIDAHSRRLLFENKLSEEEWHHLDACSHDAKKLITDMQSDPDYASLGLADILRVMTAMKHVKRSADVLLADAKPCFHNPIPIYPAPEEIYQPVAMRLPKEVLK